MSDMQHERWTLIVEFDSVAEVRASPRYMGEEAPLGEAAEFYAWLREYWCTAPDDVDEYIQWNGEIVTATVDILDALTEPVQRAMYHGVPKRVEVKRNDPR
jgi:hypothetical protein